MDLFGLIIENDNYLHKLIAINMLYKFYTNEDKIRIVYVGEDYLDVYNFSMDIVDNIPDINVKTFGMSHLYRPFKSIINENLSNIKFYKVFSVLEEFDIGTIVISPNENLNMTIGNYFSNCSTGNLCIVTKDNSLLNTFPINLMPTYYEEQDGYGFSTHNKNNPLKINTIWTRRLRNVQNNWIS